MHRRNGLAGADIALQWLITLSGLNTYNFVFLLLGILLHWQPRSLIEAFSKAMPSVSGVLLQFPFYAGIAHILTRAQNDSGTTLSDTIAHWFVGVSTNATVFRSWSAPIRLCSASSFRRPAANGSSRRPM